MHHAFLRNAVVGFDRKSGFSIIARMTPLSDHPISRVSRAGLFPCGNSSEPISKEKKSSGVAIRGMGGGTSPASMPGECMCNLTEARAPELENLAISDISG